MINEDVIKMVKVLKKLGVEKKKVMRMKDIFIMDNKRKSKK